MSEYNPQHDAGGWITLLGLFTGYAAASWNVAFGGIPEAVQYIAVMTYIVGGILFATAGGETDEEPYLSLPLSEQIGIPLVGLGLLAYPLGVLPFVAFTGAVWVSSVFLTAAIGAILLGELHEKFSQHTVGDPHGN